MEDFQAFVNDKPADISLFMFHYQDNPFPGGLSYCIHVRDPETVADLHQKYPVGMYDQLSR